MITYLAYCKKKKAADRIRDEIILACPTLICSQVISNLEEFYIFAPHIDYISKMDNSKLSKKIITWINNFGFVVLAVSEDVPQHEQELPKSVKFFSTKHYQPTFLEKADLN